jgi:hypothetical protein
MKRYINALKDGDTDDFYRTCAEVFGYDPADEDGWRLYTEYVKMVSLPLTLDGPYRHTTETARENVAFLVRNGRKLVFRDGDSVPNLPRPIHVPHEMTFVNRLQWGLASVLGGLGAESNWRTMTDAWVRGPLREVPSGR